MRRCAHAPSGHTMGRLGESPRLCISGGALQCSHSLVLMIVTAAAATHTCAFAQGSSALGALSAAAAAAAAAGSSSGSSSNHVSPQDDVCQI